MLTRTAYEDSLLASFWPRVRDFAVPPSMIETATARRHSGDWSGACAAAGVDTDLDLGSLARTHGRDLASQVRSDLRHLAPDLLRWHMPRVGPDGLLRPGITMTLARYDRAAPEGGTPVRSDRAAPGPVHPLHLVVRTPPAWADGGQRISLALWQAPNGGSRGPCFDDGARRHPHARPGRRYRLDLHRHLWDARRTDELRVRSGADGLRIAAAVAGPGLGSGTDDERSGLRSRPGSRSRVDGDAPWSPFSPAGEPRSPAGPDGAWFPSGAEGLWFRAGDDVSSAVPRPTDLDPLGLVPAELGCAVDRWAAEAAILLRAEGRTTGPVAVRLGSRYRLLLDVDLALHPNPNPDTGSGADRDMPPAPARQGPPGLRIGTAPKGGVSPLPVLPDAATWVLPDLHLLRTGAIDAERLHPLVAAALVPGHTPVAVPRAPDPAGRPRIVECRGDRHRIGLVDGVLQPLDHDRAEIRREELLVALTGTPLPCLQAIDEAHRRPHCLSGVRERLHHGDTAGALAVVEGLLGPDAVLRGGALRDELLAAAERRITYGLFRAGLTGPGPGRIQPGFARPRDHRSHPRDTTGR
ncbi:hypothetical protein ABZ341_19950 [Streptomyces sp. NPDC006173]|uniref:hypothetical protein n=1 Tax=Streptomyces sp. NPDC006173 TaxID=3155349 RepID=UPI0033D25A22